MHLFISGKGLCSLCLLKFISTLRSSTPYLYLSCVFIMFFLTVLYTCIYLQFLYIVLSMELICLLLTMLDVQAYLQRQYSFFMMLGMLVFSYEITI